MLDALAFGGFGQNRADDEGAQCRREPHTVGDDHHTEAETDGDNQKVLIVDVALEFPQQRGYQIDSDHKPENQEEDELHDAQQHLPARRGVFTGGDGGDQHHQHHGHDVLDNEHHRGEARERLVLELHVIKGFDDDGGRGHRQHTAEEEALHRPPPHHEAEQRAHPDHAEDAEEGGDEGLAAHRHQFLEAEFQTDGEHHEDDTDFGPDFHIAHIRDSGENVQVGPH